MRLNLATLQCIQLTERSSLRFKREGPTGPWFSVKFGARCQPGRLCSGSLLKQKTWYRTGKSESPGPFHPPWFPIWPGNGDSLGLESERTPVFRFGLISGTGNPPFPDSAGNRESGSRPADQETPGPANRDPDSRSRPNRESGVPCFPAKSGIGDSLPDSRQKFREIGGIGNPIS